MVQNDLVENINHHQIFCNRVFVVYFYFAEEMVFFRYDPVEDADNLGNLLSLLMFLGNSNYEKIHGFAYFFEGVEFF